tara:strand:+ start:549 stop:764 length:216 start_codon:yes stop_codon:yes gene_type:complete
MSDISKFKSVGIPITTYKKLLLICEREHRGIGQQVSKFVDDFFEKTYGGSNSRKITYKEDLANKGVGSFKN